MYLLQIIAVLELLLTNTAAVVHVFVVVIERISGREVDAAAAAHIVVAGCIHMLVPGAWCDEQPLAAFAVFSGMPTGVLSVVAGAVGGAEASVAGVAEVVVDEVVDRELVFAYHVRWL